MHDPDNSLVNCQADGLIRRLSPGYHEGTGPLTYTRYMGLESDEIRKRIVVKSTDIISLTPQYS